MSPVARGADLRIGGAPRWARPVPLLLVGLWLLLRSLAAASPADPTWLAGIYDGGDSDELVIRIGLQAAGHDASASLAVAPDPQIRPLAPPRPRGIVCAGRLILQGRSPPAS